MHSATVAIGTALMRRPVDCTPTRSADADARAVAAARGRPLQKNH